MTVLQYYCCTYSRKLFTSSSSIPCFAGSHEMVLTTCLAAYSCFLLTKPRSYGSSYQCLCTLTPYPNSMFLILHSRLIFSQSVWSININKLPKKQRLNLIKNWIEFHICLLYFLLFLRLVPLLLFQYFLDTDYTA